MAAVEGASLDVISFILTIDRYSRSVSIYYSVVYHRFNQGKKNSTELAKLFLEQHPDFVHGETGSTLMDLALHKVGEKNDAFLVWLATFAAERTGMIYVMQPKTGRNSNYSPICINNCQLIFNALSSQRNDLKER